MTGTEALHRYYRWAAVFACLAVCLYFYSAPPHTTMEDASEFILTSHYLGLPHPPGYPLFTMTAHLFSFLPGLSPALKITLLSLLAIVASAFLLGRIVCRVASSASAGCLTFVLFALSTPAWGQAIVTEVYALHALLMLLLFDQALRLRESSKNLRLWILLFALSLSHHWPLVLVSGPAFATILWPRRRELWQDRTYLSLAFVLGLSPYLYLFLAHTFSDFLFSGPVRDWEAFIQYVSRYEYRIRKTPLDADWKSSLAFARDFATLMFRDHYGVFAILGSLGIVHLWRQRNDRFLAMALLLLGCGSSVFLLCFWRTDYNVFSREIYLSFQILPMAAAAFAAGLSLPFIGQRKSIRLLVSAAAVLLVASSAFLRWPEQDLHRDRFAGNYAKVVLNALPKDALLMTNGDSDSGPLAYQHFLLGERSDITLVSGVGSLLPHKIFDRNSDLKERTHKQKIIQYISARLREGRRVFAIRASPYFEKNPGEFPFQMIPYGWFLEILPPGAEAPPLDIPKLHQMTSDFLNSLELPMKQYSYLRYELLDYPCEFLVRFGLDHPLLKALPPCQYALGEWLFWIGQDYKNADLYFQKALLAYRDWPSNEKQSIARRLLETRLLLLKDMQGDAKLAFIKETKDLLRDSIETWPFCSNAIVPPLLPLSRANEEWLEPFRACDWFKGTL